MGPAHVLVFLLIFKDYSPVIGAGEELLFDLGVPAAAVQHGRVALWSNTRRFIVIFTCRAEKK